MWPRGTTNTVRFHSSQFPTRHPSTQHAFGDTAKRTNPWSFIQQWVMESHPLPPAARNHARLSKWEGQGSSVLLRSAVGHPCLLSKTKSFQVSLLSVRVYWTRLEKVASQKLWVMKNPRMGDKALAEDTLLTNQCVHWSVGSNLIGK